MHKFKRTARYGKGQKTPEKAGEQHEEHPDGKRDDARSGGMENRLHQFPNAVEIRKGSLHDNSTAAARPEHRPQNAIGSIL